MVNVTSTTPAVFPILYTWGGEESLINSLSGLGCVDTVYSTTAITANRKRNTPHSLDIDNMPHVTAHENRCSVPNTACSSYILHTNLFDGASACQSNVVLGYGVSMMGGLFDPSLSFVALLAVVAVVGIWIVKKMVESVHGAEKLTKKAL